MTIRLGSVAMAVLLAGCGGPKAYVREGFSEHPPKRVAVLPFVITYPYDQDAGVVRPESHTIGRDVLRKTFYYAFTPYGYDDVPLADVDAALASGWGPVDSNGWSSASPQALGQALGADALIYGDISRLMHFSTPLYTETSLQASLRMVDAATGDVLWKQSVKAAERGGALLKKGQVVDFVKDQVRSLNPSVKFLRISDMAAERGLKGMPNPPMELGAAPVRSAMSGRRLAVLPLATKRPQWQKASNKLRTYLAASLQGTPFTILEINRVDAAMRDVGWTEGQPLPEGAPLAAAAERLGADTLLRGTVTTWGRSYWVLASQVKVELLLELIDAETGEVVWSQQHKNTRQAGLLKGPTGYKSLVTAPITGLKTSNLERVGNHLARSMVQELAESPAVLTYVHEPLASTASAP